MFRTVLWVANRLRGLASLPTAEFRRDEAFGRLTTIQTTDVERMCKARGWRWLPTSAKTGSNVDAAFRLVAQGHLLRVKGT